MIIFSWINAQNILFQLPNPKILLFGGQSDSCILGDKIAQNESSRALHGLSHLMPQQLQSVKNNGGDDGN